MQRSVAHDFAIHFRHTRKCSFVLQEGVVVTGQVIPSIKNVVTDVHDTSENSRSNGNEHGFQINKRVRLGLGVWVDGQRTLGT